MALRFLTAGESHGPGLVAVLEGLPAGLPISEEFINYQLQRRQTGAGSGERMKLEHDQVWIIGGVMAGETIGSPLALLIPNHDHRRWRGELIPPFTIPRPGHADLTGAVKYGLRDLRPALERASARETAARVAVGAVCRQLLAQFGITLGGYVAAIGEVQAELADIPLEERPARAEASEVCCPDPQACPRMQARIEAAIAASDTLGGIIEVAVFGTPPGLGSYVHWDRRLDSRLGAAILSVPAIKGIEIGSAFENSRLPGTQAQDAIRLEGNTLIRSTNRCGGIEGGVSNGQPIFLRAAMKPIATTLTPQPSVDLVSGEETGTRYERSDCCPLPRAVPILEAMAAYVLADALLEKLGGDSLEELRPRFAALRKTQLPDISVDGISRVYWQAGAALFDLGAED
ncbi:MAG: chorismate synthase [Anaerolineaceae bacterium]|nr:chorismate synthase [Anaerolineaceae bacterium]